MRLIKEKPFLVVRAAGSGMEGSGDLLALRGDLCFPIEVKTTKKDKLYLSGRTVDQYQAMLDEGERCGLMPLYAHRRKGVRGDSWRIFRVETSNLTGGLRHLEKSIPAFSLTRNGKPYLNWEDGLPLNKFISMLCSQSDLKTMLIGLEQRAQEMERILARDEELISSNQERRRQTDILAELSRRRSK